MLDALGPDLTGKQFKTNSRLETGTSAAGKDARFWNRRFWNY